MEASESEKTQPWSGHSGGELGNVPVVENEAGRPPVGDVATVVVPTSSPQNLQHVISALESPHPVIDSDERLPRAGDTSVLSVQGHVEQNSTGATSTHAESKQTHTGQMQHPVLTPNESVNVQSTNGTPERKRTTTQSETSLSAPSRSTLSEESEAATDSRSDDGIIDYIRSAERQNAIVERSPGGRYIRFMEKLGSGASKDVYRAYDTQEGIEVAWNVVNLSGVPKNERNRIVNEVRLLERLHHHNIISFHGSWVNRERQEVNFVTEILSSGTLKAFIRKVQVIRWKIAKRWAVQILQGLDYLHSQDPPVIHRDLKCENVFINGTSGDLRIGDLGLSTVHRNGKVLSVLGTPEFMAPDMYEDSSYDEKVDIYAFGMVLLEIFTKEIPYSECKNPAQIYKKVSRGDPPEVLSRLQSKHARDFVKLCLGYKDEAGRYIRPSAAELLQHPFLLKRENDEDEVGVDPPLRESVISEGEGESSTTSHVSSNAGKRGLAAVPSFQTSDDASQTAIQFTDGLASTLSHPPPASMDSMEDEGDEDGFQEMPESETNIRKVKVLMGRGKVLHEDETGKEPGSPQNQAEVMPPNPLMDHSTPLPGTPDRLQDHVPQARPSAQESDPSQATTHYLVAAAVIENESPNVRPYADDILKLVVTLPVEGQTQNVQFDFHLVEDDPVQVAKEMVRELGIPEGAVLEISGTISGLARAARMKQDKYANNFHGSQSHTPSQQPLVPLAPAHLEYQVNASNLPLQQDISLSQPVLQLAAPVQQNGSLEGTLLPEMLQNQLQLPVQSGLQPTTAVFLHDHNQVAAQSHPLPGPVNLSLHVSPNPVGTIPPQGPFADASHEMAQGQLAPSGVQVQGVTYSTSQELPTQVSSIIAAPVAPPSQVQQVLHSTMYVSPPDVQYINPSPPNGDATFASTIPALPPVGETAAPAFALTQPASTMIVPTVTSSSVFAPEVSAIAPAVHSSFTGAPHQLLVAPSPVSVHIAPTLTTAPIIAMTVSPSPIITQVAAPLSIAAQAQAPMTTPLLATVPQVPSIHSGISVQSSMNLPVLSNGVSEVASELVGVQQGDLPAQAPDVGEGSSIKIPQAPNAELLVLQVPNSVAQRSETIGSSSSNNSEPALAVFLEMNGSPSSHGDSDSDDELLEEMRKLDEDYQRNLQRAKKVFDNRMDSLQRSQIEREAQHLKTLEKHEKERVEFEKRMAQEAEQQLRRIEHLQREFDRRREVLAQNKKKMGHLNGTSISITNLGPDLPPLPASHSSSSIGPQLGGGRHARTPSGTSSQSHSPVSSEHKHFQDPNPGTNGN